MKRLMTAFLAAGITVSSMTAVFAEPAHKGRIQARTMAGN